MSHPDRDIARQWLTAARIDNFECGHCDGVHLSAIDAGDGPLECRIMWQGESLLLLTQVELRPSAVLPMAALATGFSTDFSEIKVHAECLDEEPPSLVISHAIPSFIPLARGPFVDWIRWYIDQTQRILEEIRQTGLLGPAEMRSAAGGALH